MLRDNLAGLIEPMLSSAGAYLSRCALTRTSHRNDRPQNALKIPARQSGIYVLTENVPSPLHAEPRHFHLRRAGVGLGERRRKFAAVEQSFLDRAIGVR
jgi:hypothetical protein